MDEREKKEEQNKRIGWLTSVGVQLVLLILFYFIVAWKEPFPPIPEYGIELGFTTSSGAPAASSPTQTPVTEEVQQEQETLTASESEPVPAESESTETEESIEEQDVPVTEAETQVQVEETKPQESTPVEEVQKEEPEEPKVDERAVMQASETESNETNENTSEGEEEEQEVDQRAIYGSQGADTGDSEGANLSMSGWVWDFKPKPDDQSDQSGKIVYKIVVDGDGYLVKIETVTSTVSPSVERKYRQAVEKLTFSKTADYKAAPVSTGTITFIIKSK